MNVPLIHSWIRKDADVMLWSCSDPGPRRQCHDQAT
jgi:hypothetical protein